MGGDREEKEGTMTGRIERGERRQDERRRGRGKMTRRGEGGSTTTVFMLFSTLAIPNESRRAKTFEKSKNVRRRHNSLGPRLNESIAKAAQLPCRRGSTLLAPDILSSGFNDTNVRNEQAKRFELFDNFLILIVFLIYLLLLCCMFANAFRPVSGCLDYLDTLYELGRRSYTFGSASKCSNSFGSVGAWVVFFEHKKNNNKRFGKIPGRIKYQSIQF